MSTALQRTPYLHYDSGMAALLQVPLCLLHQLPDQQYDGCCAISAAQGDVASMVSKFSSGCSCCCKETTSPLLISCSPCDIVLCYSCTCDHDCCWVLYLHLTQKYVPVLCELDICSKAWWSGLWAQPRAARAMHGKASRSRLTTGTTNKHLYRPLRPKVGLHDFVQTFGGIYVHKQGRVPAHDFRLRIQHFDTTHFDSDT